MSDKDSQQETPDDEQDAAFEDLPIEEVLADEGLVDKAQDEAKPARSSNLLAWLAFLLALLAFAAAGYVAWQDWSSTDDITASNELAELNARVVSNGSRTQQSLAALQAEIAVLAAEDPGVDAAIDALRRDFEERVRLLGSLPARLATLESSVASLAGISEGARDAWVLAESEYYMQIANAQLQLANNPHLASLALEMADERIVQLANPALTNVRQAISDELATLDGVEKPDIEGATLTLSSLARVVETLPLASESTTADEVLEIDPDQGGVSRAWSSVKSAMSGLVKVTPPEQVQLVQLSPDAEFFLRNNIALQLQSARLALLRGEQAIFEQSLDDTSALLTGYFDTDSAAVSSALETIAEIRGHVFTAAMPDISESLRLLRQFRTLDGSAQ